MKKNKKILIIILAIVTILGFNISAEASCVDDKIKECQKSCPTGLNGEDCRLACQVKNYDNECKGKPTEGQLAEQEHLNEIKEEVENKDKNKDKVEANKVSSDQKLCEAEIMNDLKNAWRLLQIAAPILVILFGSFDFAQAVISQDNDAMKKATSKFSKRLFCAIALFFLPILVNLLFNLSGIDKSISDFVCGIG